MEEPILEHLLASDHPEALISRKTWQSWIAKLSRSSVSSKTIFEIANELGLDWVYSRRDESLSQYLKGSITDILWRKGFGKKKARTVILCVAATALASEPVPMIRKATKPESVCIKKNIGPPYNARNEESTDILLLEHLLASDHPWALISRKTWQSWIAKLSRSSVSSKPIFEIANELGLDWVYSRRDESLSQYLKGSITDILWRKGFGKKKARTVILCVAATALASEPVPMIRKATKPESVCLNKNNEESTDIFHKTLLDLLDIPGDLKQSDPESVCINKNNEETTNILHKTLLDLLDIPADLKQSVWKSFEDSELSSLVFPDKEWKRIANYGLYPEDGLETVLVLSLEYIYAIWKSEEAFTDIIRQVALLAERAMNREVKWDIEAICDPVMLIEDSKIGPLGNLYITRSFIPDEHLQFLYASGIFKWNDLKLSMRDVLRLYGLTFKLIEFLVHLQALQPDIKRVVSYMAPISQNGPASSSFESLMGYLILRRIRVNRDVEILMQRMAWGCECSETLETLGRKTGLTRERVRQIEQKLLRRVKHASFLKDLVPLWVVVLSSIEAHGVLSVSEIAMLLQSHFGWPKPPSIEGLTNLLSTIWSDSFTKNGIELVQGFLSCSGLPCTTCSKVHEYITSLMSSCTEMPITEAVSKIRSFCIAECDNGMSQRFVPSESFVEFLVTRQKAASDSIMISQDKDKLLNKEQWNLQNGSILSAAEAILRRSGKPMHFTEIHEEILKSRGDIKSLNGHTVHAALGRSENILLWDRGTYIHKQKAPFPFSIIRYVETWLRDKLDGIPFITVFGAFRAFQQQCIDAGVPSESALYSCLRVSADPTFEYPKYPYIYVASTYAGRLSLPSVIEGFVKGYDGVVPLNILKEYAVEGLHIKEFMLSQLLERTPNILRTQTGYLHVDLMDIDEAKLAEIIEYTKGLLSKERHVSVVKIFSSREVTCRSMGIDEPVLLYSVLQMHSEDTFRLANYPQIHILTENDERGIKGVAESVTEYIRQKRAPVTYQELYGYFCEKLGYSKNTIYLVVNREGVFKFLPSCVVHYETIGWSPDMSANVEALAEQVYSDEEKAGRCFASIETMIEKDEDLPELSDGMYWTEFLMADILNRSKRFRLLGSTRTAYVLVPNSFGIESFEDLCYVILKRDYEGAASLETFTQEMIDSGIIAHSVTPSMLGSSEKVTIVGKEILLTELIQ